MYQPNEYFGFHRYPSLPFQAKFNSLDSTHSWISDLVSFHNISLTKMIQGPKNITICWVLCLYVPLSRDFDRVSVPSVQHTKPKISDRQMIAQPVAPAMHIPSHPRYLS